MAVTDVPQLTRGKGEAVEAFAERRYRHQISYYEACGGSGFLKWEQQSGDVREHWIGNTRRICGKK